MTPASPLIVNQAVPAFTAVSTAGDVSLENYAGKALVLYFYPKDATPGCTMQGQNFRDCYDDFAAAGAEVVGVSRDNLKSHESFRAKMGFPFALISDHDEALCNLFGVIRMKNMYGKQVQGIERSTFVVGADGKLLREWRGVRVPGHVEEVLEYVRSLRLDRNEPRAFDNEPLTTRL